MPSQAEMFLVSGLSGLPNLWNRHAMVGRNDTIYAMVGGNAHRHGSDKKRKDEVKYNWC